MYAHLQNLVTLIYILFIKFVEHCTMRKPNVCIIIIIQRLSYLADD